MKGNQHAETALAPLGPTLFFRSRARKFCAAVRRYPGAEACRPEGLAEYCTAVSVTER
jgi:hypothetical protein